MSSVNKTEYLGLNSWAGTDRPERADFNSDNDLIDAAVQTHFEDGDVHITPEEREIWNTPYYCGIYAGNDLSQRTIETACPFEAAFGFVFCISAGAVSVDFENETAYNHFGIAAQNGNMAGVKLSGTDLIVKQSADSVGDYGCMSFNASGSMYMYILFR